MVAQIPETRTWWPIRTEWTRRAYFCPRCSVGTLGPRRPEWTPPIGPYARALPVPRVNAREISRDLKQPDHRRSARTHPRRWPALFVRCCPNTPPPWHEIYEPHPRVHVVDRPEPTLHARQGGGGGGKPEHNPPGKQSNYAFCTSCLHLTGPRDLLENGCFEADTDDPEEQREGRF